MPGSGSNTRVKFKKGTGSLPSFDNGSLVFSEDSGKIYIDTHNGRVEMHSDLPTGSLASGSNNVTVDKNIVLSNGTSVRVYGSRIPTTLNINSTGSKSVKLNGSTLSSEKTLGGNTVITYTYISSDDAWVVGGSVSDSSSTDKIVYNLQLSEDENSFKFHTLKVDSLNNYDFNTEDYNRECYNLYSDLVNDTNNVVLIGHLSFSDIPFQFNLDIGKFGLAAMTAFIITCLPYNYSTIVGVDYDELCNSFYSYLLPSGEGSAIISRSLHGTGEGQFYATKYVGTLDDFLDDLSAELTHNESDNRWYHNTIGKFFNSMDILDSSLLYESRILLNLVNTHIFCNFKSMLNLDADKVELLYRGVDDEEGKVYTVKLLSYLNRTVSDPIPEGYDDVFTSGSIDVEESTFYYVIYHSVIVESEFNSNRTIYLTTSQGSIIPDASKNTSSKVADLFDNNDKKLIEVDLGKLYFRYWSEKLVNSVGSVSLTNPITLYQYSSTSYVGTNQSGFERIVIVHVNQSQITELKTITGISDDGSLVDALKTTLSQALYSTSPDSSSAGYNELSDNSIVGYYRYIFEYKGSGSSSSSKRYVIDIDTSNPTVQGIIPDCKIFSVTSINNATTSTDIQTKLGNLYTDIMNSTDSLQDIEVVVKGVRLDISLMSGTITMRGQLPTLPTVTLLAKLTEDNGTYYLGDGDIQYSPSILAVGYISESFVFSNEYVMSLSYNNDRGFLFYDDITEIGDSFINYISAYFEGDTSFDFSSRAFSVFCNIYINGNRFELLDRSISENSDDYVYFEGMISGLDHYFILQNEENITDIPDGWNLAFYHNEREVEGSTVQDGVIFLLIRKEIDHYLTFTGSSLTTIDGVNSDDSTQLDSEKSYKNLLISEILLGIQVKSLIFPRDIHDIMLHVSKPLVPSGVVFYCYYLTSHDYKNCKFTIQDEHILPASSGYDIAHNVITVTEADVTLTSSGILGEREKNRVDSLESTVSGLSTSVNNSATLSKSVDVSTGTLSDDDTHLPTSKLVKDSIAASESRSIAVAQGKTVTRTYQSKSDLDAVVNAAPVSGGVRTLTVNGEVVKHGDIFLIIDTSTPDYWWDTQIAVDGVTGNLRELEARSMDLSGYVTSTSLTTTLQNYALSSSVPHNAYELSDHASLVGYYSTVINNATEFSAATASGGAVATLLSHYGMVIVKSKVAPPTGTSSSIITILVE